VIANLFRRIAEQLLDTADVRLNGDRPWDIQVHDRRAFQRAVIGGSVGLGDAFVENWWSCGDLEELAYRFALNRVEEKAAFLPAGIAHKAASLLLNQQTRHRALRVAQQHYGIDNELFLSFLGAHKNYSCAYFRDTEDLDVAQRQKMDLLCRKLCLQPGEHLLDVGGGWGEFARYAAKEYGVRVTSINICDEQIRFAREYCRGLDVEVVRCDYRDVRGSFDKVLALAMFTHVGSRNYRTFMETIARVLKPSGIFVMEGIWGNVSTTNIDGWLDKYVFPGGMLPSGAQTFRAFEGIFHVEDLHNFGPSYVKTLRAWNENFQAAWPKLSARHHPNLRRIFEYYFLICAGYFRARAIQNWHLVLAPNGRTQPACRVA